MAMIDTLDLLVRRRSGRLSGHAFESAVKRHRCRTLALSKFRVVGVNNADGGGPSLPVHSAAVTALDLETQDHRYVLAGNGDGTVYIHDTANIGGGSPSHASTLIAKIKRARDGGGGGGGFGHVNCVTCVQWFPEDSGLFLTAAMDGKLKACTKLHNTFFASKHYCWFTGVTVTW